MSLGLGRLPTKWHFDPSSRLATTDMGRKLGWGLLCPFLGVDGCPSNNVAWAEAHLRIKRILMYPAVAVWPQ